MAPHIAFDIQLSHTKCKYREHIFRFIIILTVHVKKNGDVRHISCHRPHEMDKSLSYSDKRNTKTLLLLSVKRQI